MVYAIAGLGAGMRRRRKEIRNERAQIREEFERWRQNNPYATAADFHAKVKQLGSSTPGGSVALPDGMAIQRMAQENALRKQEEEAEKERLRRVNALNLRTAEANALRDIYADKPDTDTSTALMAIGRPVDAAGVALAEAARSAAQRSQVDRDREINIAKANYVETLLRNNPLMSLDDVEQRADSLYGGTPMARAANASATGSPASSSAGEVSRIVGFLDAEMAQVDSPRNMELALQLARRRAIAAGRSEEEFEAALEQSIIYQRKLEDFSMQAFKQRVEGATDIANLVGVVDGVDVPLSKMEETAFNNTGYLTSAYIPPGAEVLAATVLGNYLTLNEDGEPQLKADFAAMDAIERDERIRADLAALGIGNKEEILAAQQAAVSGPKLKDATVYVEMMEREKYDDLATEIAAIQELTTAAEKERAKTRLLSLLAAEEATLFGRDKASVYAAGFPHPEDVLPRGADITPIREWFAQAREKVEAIDPMAGTIADTEAAAGEQEAKLEALKTDAILESRASPVGDNELSSIQDALRRNGYFGQRLDNIDIMSAEGGETSFVSPFRASELQQIFEGENARLATGALRAAMQVYANYSRPAVTGDNILQVGSSLLGTFAQGPMPRIAEATKTAQAFLVDAGMDAREASTIAAAFRNAGLFGEGYRSKRTLDLIEALGLNKKDPMAGVQAIDDTGTPVINF